MFLATGCDSDNFAIMKQKRFQPAAAPDLK